MRKKQKGFRKELVMPIFIVLIMVMSVFGYMWGSSKTKLTYNGFKFTQLENGEFMLKINKKPVIFNYFPASLESMNVSSGIKNVFNSPMVYFTYNPDSEYAGTIAQIQFNAAQLLSEVKNIYVQNAFTSESEEYDIPVVTCKNATASIPVIKIEIANSTEIDYDNYCIIIKAMDKQQLFMAYERFLYSVFGVIQ